MICDTRVRPWPRRQGATTKDLMRRLGHASPAAANRYLHTVDGRDKEIAAAPAGIWLRTVTHRAFQIDRGEALMGYAGGTNGCCDAAGPGRDPFPEKRKVGGSTPPLTTTLTSGNAVNAVYLWPIDSNGFSRSPPRACRAPCASHPMWHARRSSSSLRCPNGRRSREPCAAPRQDQVAVSRKYGEGRETGLGRSQLHGGSARFRWRCVSSG